MKIFQKCQRQEPKNFFDKNVMLLLCDKIFGFYKSSTQNTLKNDWILSSNISKKKIVDDKKNKNGVEYFFQKQQNKFSVPSRRKRKVYTFAFFIKILQS